MAFLALAFVLAANVSLTTNEAKAVDTEQVLVGLLDTLETVTAISPHDAYYSNFQLVPVTLDAAGYGGSSPVEVKVYTSLNGLNWTLWGTLTDAITAGVGDTIWGGYLGAVRGVRFTQTVQEYDSMSVLPYVMQVED